MPTKLNDCACCEGITAIVPGQVFNRPGLSQVRYRVGTQVDFLRSALAALSDPEFSALRSLTTRDTDDFTIALLDGWATLADVLTFYQERIANEFWLRTATERDSILRLAQLIGYRLKPGVAAETRLSFFLDETPGAPTEVPLEIGTKVQSVPGTNEKAQTFETVEEINARVEWNAIKPQTTKEQKIVFNGEGTFPQRNRHTASSGRRHSHRRCRTRKGFGQRALGFPYFANRRGRLRSRNEPGSRGWKAWGMSSRMSRPLRKIQRFTPCASGQRYSATMLRTLGS